MRAHNSSDNNQMLHCDNKTRCEEIFFTGSTTNAYLFATANLSNLLIPVLYTILRNVGAGTSLNS